MDLSTGPGLVAGIIDFLDRSDLDPTTVQTWIRLFEGTLNINLRVREMEKTVTSTIASEYTPLPGDYLELIEAFVNAPKSAQRSLRQTTLDNLQDMRRTFPTGSPTHYAIVGNQIELGPVPASAMDVRLVYFARLQPLDLTTVGATHWLLTKAPHLYFYGALIHSAGFLLDQDRIQEFTDQAAQALAGLNQANIAAKHGGSRLNAKTRTFG